MVEETIGVPIPLQSTADAQPPSLPSSPSAEHADVSVTLPFVTPSCSLAIQAKRVWLIRNALVASKVGACSAATLVEIVQKNVTEGGEQVEKDEFMEMLRLLPDVRGGEAFHPLDDTLDRIFRTFQAAGKASLVHLGIGCLVLVQGSVQDKVEAALDLIQLASSSPITRADGYTRATMDLALLCLLLAVSALFDEVGASLEQLEASAAILTTSVREAVGQLWRTHGLEENATLAKGTAWAWIDEKPSSKGFPWLKLVDQSKWPTNKRLTSPRASSGPSSPVRSAQKSTIDEEDGDDAYDDEDEAAPTALNFRFSGVDGGVLTIGEGEAETLFGILQISAFTKVHAQTMYDTFVQHTGDGLLEEDTFLEAIEELVSMTDRPHLMQENDFLDRMLDIFRCFLPEGCVKVDAFEIAAGFSMFAWGSKSDKLASAFHFFDGDSKGFLNRQQLWRFLRSVLITLLYLSPPSDNIVVRYGSFAELVDTGEQEIMENVMDGMNETDGDEVESEKRARTNSEVRLGVYTFEEFGLWYNSGGFKGMSWLELLDLRKWMFVSPQFDVEALDVEPVDPVLASANYYTAQNIQVDVDSGNGVVKNGPHPGYFQGIQEEEDEDESVPPDSFRHSQSSYSSATTGPSRHGGSVNSTLPAICLKNEVILEFDLAFDTDDDSTVEIPLDTLSFDNGDLIQYFELQRVMRLNEVELYRLYEVFEPFMANASSAWMEKSTFDECIKDLLPRDISAGVAAAFGVHPNTRVPPPSIGRAKDCKMVADTLSRLFFAFNRGGTGKIDLVEFVSAFSLFFAGSKSDKLNFAHRLFDADEDGALTRREMWKYIRSFLTILLALGNGAELSAEAIASVADATAIAIADAIFKDTNKTFSVRQMPSYQRQSHRFSLDTPESADTVVASRNNQRRGQYYHRGSLPNVNSLSIEGGVSMAGPGAGSAFIRGGVVTFEEFAKWYSTNGYNIIAWIELLDAKKWPHVNQDVTNAILQYISRQQHAMADAAARGSAGPDSGSTFDTDASNGRSSSLEAEYTGDLTPLNTDKLNTNDGRAIAAMSEMPSVGGIGDLIMSPSSAASSNRDLSSVALQFKLTSFDSTTLRIRLKDVAIVYTISERMNLSSVACEELLNKFNQQGSGRSLTKTGYLRTMRDLVPRQQLSNEDQEFLSFHLLRIFALFEAESVLDDAEDDDDGSQSGAGSPTTAPDQIKKTSSVEKLHILAGLSIFCAGSKSAKLGVLFKLFDTHGDGYVSRRHLFEMLKSILVVLFAFSSYNSNKAHTNDTTINTWSTNSAAERAAGAVISKLFCEAKCKYPDAITLAEFATWYAGGGYLDCPWLELLDLTKWPAKEAFEASKREKPLIYAFDMLEEGNILHFTESDISTYLFMLRSTKLADLNVSKIYDALLTFATPSAEEALKMSRAEQGKGGGQDYSYAAVEEDEGAYLVLTRSNYYECIRSLVPKEDMSEKAQQTSSKLLSRLFNVYDRKRCGRVHALEIACGMSILGRGSKSQKLSMAFDFITKMRQQRHRTLTNYASMNPGGYNGGGGGFGVNSISTGGGFGWASTRGAMSTTTGLRRSMLQNESNALPHSVLFIYLRSFLLALMALSDGTYRLGLEKMYAEADDFIEEAMGDLMTEVAANGNNGGMYAGYGTARSRARVTFEQFGEWYNAGGFELISWVELLDIAKWEQQQEFQEQALALDATASRTFKSTRIVSQRHASTKPVEPMRTSPKRTTQKQQIRQSDIVSTSYAHGVRSKVPKAQPLSTHRESTHRESLVAASLSSDGPIMVFAIHADAAELQFFNDDLGRLKGFLRETQLHQESPWNLAAAMKAALQVNSPSTAVEVSRGQIIDAIQGVCLSRVGASTGMMSDESVDLVHSVIEVFVKEPTSSNIYHRTSEDEEDESINDKVDLGSVLCGLLVICDGPMLEKLKCAAKLIDDSIPDHSIETSLSTLKHSLVCFLMTLYGISCSLSGEVVRYSAQLGADAVLGAFTSSATEEEPSDSPGGPTVVLDLEKPVSLKDFCDWFSESGYHSYQWLELAEFQHWPKAINICSDAL